MAKRLLVVLVVVLFAAGGLVAALHPWTSGLGPLEAASLLRQRVRSPDRFDCHEPSGFRSAGELDWTYVCIDLTHPGRRGYLVKTSGKRITDIERTG